MYTDYVMHSCYPIGTTRKETEIACGAGKTQEEAEQIAIDFLRSQIDGVEITLTYALRDEVIKIVFSKSGHVIYRHVSAEEEPMAIIETNVQIWIGVLTERFDALQQRGDHLVSYVPACLDRWSPQSDRDALAAAQILAERGEITIDQPFNHFCRIEKI